VADAPVKTQRRWGRIILAGVILGVAAVWCAGAYHTWQRDVLTDRMVRAVRKEEFGEAARLVRQGVDPNVRVPAGPPVPVKPAWAHLWDLLRGRTSKPAKTGRSALTYAALFGEVELARALLEAGANANVEDEWTDSAYSRVRPLDLAVYNAQSEMVALLLRHGADPNQSGWEGIGPLAGAVRMLYYISFAENHLSGRYSSRAEATARHEQIVRLLVRYGADVNARDADGKSAMDYAHEYAQYPKRYQVYPHIERLLKGASKQLPNR
jgi:uncharacterized protein